MKNKDNKQIVAYPLYHLFETESGQSILMAAPDGVETGIIGDPTIAHTKLDISPDEFTALQRKAETHHIHYDHATKKVMAIPKKQPIANSGLSG